MEITLVIAGSRSINNRWATIKAWRYGPWDSEVVETIISGDARGPDEHAEKIAEWNDIPYEEYEADWNIHGNEAGHFRNAEMAEDGDALIAVWDGESNGTYSMIKKALAKGLDVYTYVVNDD